MKDDEMISKPSIPGNESLRESWKKAFLVYILVEAFIITFQYLITWNKCSVCVLPVPFYISGWVKQLLFTGLMWYGLYRLSFLKSWAIILLNLPLFLFYYFSYIGASWLIINSGQEWLVGKQPSEKPYSYFIYGSWIDIAKYVLIAASFYVLKFYFDYRKSQKQRINLAAINKDMQLNLLRQQLSPHFYFNTLNNLYGLARINSVKLPAALDQLSNIMHYVIEDCNKPKVLLHQEIKFLESYIALEKLRYETGTIIDMKVDGIVDNQAIMPMLLIQFVENAFKHGMKEKLEQNWMKVKINVSNEWLHFTVNNSIHSAPKTGGIGINSVKHILNLQYDGKYELDLLQEPGCFSVTLKLNLS